MAISHMRPSFWIHINYSLQIQLSTYRSGIGVWSYVPQWKRVKKWKVVLQSILELDFREPTEREKLS